MKIDTSTSDMIKAIMLTVTGLSLGIVAVVLQVTQ